MLQRSVLFVVALIFVFAVEAQKIMISGQQTSRPLVWEDFKGQPDGSVDYYAFTYWNISYQYDAFQFEQDVVKWKVNIIVELGKNSWKKNGKLSDSLLSHEQGHFNIGILCAMELQHTVDNTIFLKTDYQTKLAAIIKETVERYKQMDLLYDKETDHLKNREQQKKWDRFFSAEIARLKKLQRGG
jgi:predicted secreted Zn-dependent protease